MTGPYPADIKDRLTRSMRHGVTVTAKPLAGPEIPLDVDSLRVKFSEDWSPHIQANFTTKVPSSAAVLDALDPRKGCRVSIDAGYIYPGDRPFLYPLADLHYRGRDTSRPANDLAHAAASDEARAQDYLKLWPGVLPPRNGIAEMVSWLAGYAVHPETPVVSSSVGALYGGAALADMDYDIGTDHWSVMADAAARAGVWVYCDDRRRWRIRRKPELAAVPAYVLETGARGNITGSVSTLDREPWYNSVLLRYRWKDAAGTERVVHGRASVTSGPFAVSAVGYKTYFQDLPMAASQAGANTVAAARVRNLVSRGRSFRMDVANAAYWLRPGDTVEVRLPTGGPELHLISSIEFSPLEGSMAIQTRVPQDVVITTGE